MRKKICFFVACLLVIFLARSIPYADDTINRGDMTPRDNDGRKWRIGYLESESFVNYAGTLNSLVEGLDELSWINHLDGMDYTEGQTDTREMWQWLSHHPVSEHLEFIGDAHYTLSDMKAHERMEIEKLLEENSLDLMIVMGTAAGDFVADKKTDTALMIYAASNAVQSGMIESETDSGRDNLWAHMDANRFQRQVSVFHEMFGFQTLGIVYEDSPVARSYSAIDDIESIACEKGFTVQVYHVNEPVDASDRPRYYREVKHAYENLAEDVDALYMTVASLESSRIPELLEPFYDKDIPVFSQLGESEVKNGALMSVNINDLKNIGRFGADNMVRYFSGESLRLLPQVFESTPTLIINLEAAERMCYQVPFDVLLSADKVYMRIGGTNGTGY